VRFWRNGRFRTQRVSHLKPGANLKRHLQESQHMKKTLLPSSRSQRRWFARHRRPQAHSAASPQACGRIDRRASSVVRSPPAARPMAMVSAYMSTKHSVPHGSRALLGRLRAGASVASRSAMIRLPGANPSRLDFGNPAPVAGFFYSPRPESGRLRRVSKDDEAPGPSWFETSRKCALPP